MPKRSAEIRNMITRTLKQTTATVMYFDKQTLTNQTEQITMDGFPDDKQIIAAFNKLYKGGGKQGLAVTERNEKSGLYAMTIDTFYKYALPVDQDGRITNDKPQETANETTETEKHQNDKKGSKK